MKGRGVSVELAKKLALATRGASRLATERDRLIIEAHRDGASLREIARLAGMSHEKVRALVEAGR